ncbi:hypothetical protein SLA2020_423100 [Shorea laevis]
MPFALSKNSSRSLYKTSLWIIFFCTARSKLFEEVAMEALEAVEAVVVVLEMDTLLEENSLAHDLELKACSFQVERR